MTRHVIDHNNADRILDWMRTRGGILIWKSINLSNPALSWTTPALTEEGEPYSKPNWQSASSPDRHITDPSEVDVTTAVEVKRFHVGVRIGSQGLMAKVTDGGSRRIRAEVEKAEEKYGKPAWHEFDYGDHNNAVIFVEGERMSLSELAEGS
jgi:hypothetical protein